MKPEFTYSNVVRSIAEEIKLNLDVFDFDRAVDRNNALIDLFDRITDTDTILRFRIRGIEAIYNRYQRSDMEHLYDIVEEIVKAMHEL